MHKTPLLESSFFNKIWSQPPQHPLQGGSWSQLGRFWTPTWTPNRLQNPWFWEHHLNIPQGTKKSTPPTPNCYFYLPGESKNQWKSMSKVIRISIISASPSKIDPGEPPERSKTILGRSFACLRVSWEAPGTNMEPKVTPKMVPITPTNWFFWVAFRKLVSAPGSEN